MTILNTKVNIKKVKNMGKVLIFGKMVLGILVNGLKIKFMEEASIHGMTVESMREIGKIIIWMAMVLILGKMDVNMKDSIKKIKNMVLEFTHGQMVGNMTETG